MRDRSRASLLFAVCAGLLLWMAAAALSGRREPWDSPLYWTVAYPAALVLSALVGYWHPQRAWLRALVLFEAQFIAMCIRSGEVGNLWPLSLIVLAVVAIPGMLVATLAAHVGRNEGMRAEE